MPSPQSLHDLPINPQQLIDFLYTGNIEIMQVLDIEELMACSMVLSLLEVVKEQPHVVAHYPQYQDLFMLDLRGVDVQSCAIILTDYIAELKGYGSYDF